MNYFNSMGVLEDVTDAARKLGFDPSHTYASAYDEIVIDGRQYCFPCNISAHGMWVNKDVFEKAGMSPPPWNWSLDEFERMGKELVRKANVGRSRREVFIAGDQELPSLLRSVGLDRFNETMTACVLDDPRYVDMLKRVYRWTFVDNIIPRPEDNEALSAQQAGYGGNQLSWFNRGNIATMHSGRYALIQFRQFNDARRQRGEKPLSLGVVQHPNGGFAVSSLGARSVVVYVGSPNKEYAKYFLAFLASQEYNMQVVADADSLPPDPAYARTEEFLRPAKYPEEHGVHEPWARLANEIAIPGSYSPFVLDRVATRIFITQRERFMSGQDTAEQVARRTEHMINAEIQRRLHEEPTLKPLYGQRVADQKRIDELRAKGEPVPLNLITNPFHRKYYVAMGWSK
jgi:multiple sugar transport system substrate-binding protein